MSIAHSNNVCLLGCKVSNLSKEELLNSIQTLIRNNNYPSLMLSANVHSINLAQKYSWIKKINNLKPDILVVGFGMPLQEKWILNNQEKLLVKVIMTGGNCFRYISGKEKRAPIWMRKYGMEWFFRFIQEPRRLFKRYLIGNPLFFIRIFFDKFKICHY